MEHDAYITKLKDSLSSGWNGFTADLVEVVPPSPEGIPNAYIMKPYDAKIKYMGRPWQTVRIEIGHNEIGDADEFEEFLPDEIAVAFERLQFPRPRPLRVMKLSYQIAQKIHAVSEPGNDRPHDLIDLQLICLRSDIDMVDVKEKCLRLFDYRRRQAWPPVVRMGIDWTSKYTGALETIADRTDILPTIDDAVDWVNDLIAKIAAS